MARIAAIGLVVHDHLLHLDHLPAPGASAVISRMSDAPGGTTANTAVALARLGESVTLRAVIGNDDEGPALLTGLRNEGVDCRMITVASGEPTGATFILLDSTTGERTILWRKGAAIRKGDPIDIAALFGHDVVILDMADEPLRRFLTDLPAHTRPDVQLLGSVTSIVDNDEPDAIEVAFRFDAITGTATQFLHLMHAGDLTTLIAAVQTRMTGNQLRAATVTLGAEGCLWITPGAHGFVPGFPVDTRDTTGAGDAFTAGVARGMARRWPWPRTARFANALGALSTRRCGAQSALPSLNEVETLLAAHE